MREHLKLKLEACFSPVFARSLKKECVNDALQIILQSQTSPNNHNDHHCFQRFQNCIYSIITIESLCFLILLGKITMTPLNLRLMCVIEAAACIRFSVRRRSFPRPGVCHLKSLSLRVHKCTECRHYSIKALQQHIRCTLNWYRNGFFFFFCFNV